MGRKDSWRTIAATVLACLMGAAGAAYAQPKRIIGDGIVVSVRGPSHAMTTLGSNLSQTQSTVPGTQVRNLAPGIFFLDNPHPATVTASSDATRTPRVYSRKTNPCKRAKIRKWLATLSQRVRCEPNWGYQAAVTPDDPSYSLQYASSFLSLPSAWDKTTGSTGPIVVVIDSGVQYTHPDLAANMWSNPNEIPANGVDDDSNGYVDDVHGVNTITGSGDPMDESSHGTHCAGILGAQGNNAMGIAGVAWTTKIVAVKFIDADGFGYLSDAIQAIQYATDLKQAGHNIVVSSNSWGGGGYSASLFSAIQQSTNAGILFVAAAGNNNSDNDVYPAYPASYNLHGIISVASTNESGQRSSFSNFGATSVDIAAPGSAILSCIPTNSYATYSGTSMAAPQVSGIAVLAQAICNSTLTVSQLKGVILNSGVTYPNLSGYLVTGAIANAANAVVAADGLCNPTPPPAYTPSPTPSAIPTSTPIPEDTPKPEPPAPVPPTSTPKQGSGSNPKGRFSVDLTPGRDLKAATLLTIGVQNAGDAQSVSLQLFGTDSRRQSFSCPVLRAPLSDGATKITFNLPASVRNFKSLGVMASAGRSSARDSASVSQTPRPKSAKQLQTAIRQFCSALRKGSD